MIFSSFMPKFKKDVMENLTDKVALVTGGSKGIGYGVAQALANSGLKVAITGRNKERIEDAAKELSNSTNSEILALVADVRKYDELENAVTKIKDKWGAIDVVVANAGVGHYSPIDQTSLEDWQNTIDTNLTGVFHTVKASVEELKKSQGYLITISSLAGTNFFANGAAYNASKFGLTGFTQAVMLDLRHYGVKVSTIMPGSVATYFNDHTPTQADNWKIQKEDLGQMVVDLLRMNPRTLPSKIEVRPTQPPKK